MLTLETTQQPTYNLKARIAGAVAATCAVGVVAAVAMSNTSATVKRTGLFNIPEDFKGHFTGGQRTGEWNVNGKFHKFETASGDWRIDSKLTLDGSVYVLPKTYTFKENVLVTETLAVDGSRYEMECGPRDEVPGYGKWSDILDKAQALSRSDMSEKLQTEVESTCPEGSDAVQVKFEGNTWTVCGDSTAQTRAMYAFTETFSFQAVSRPNMVVDIEHPAGYEKLNCSAFDISLDREEYTKAFMNMAHSVQDTDIDQEEGESEVEVDDERELESVYGQGKPGNAPHPSSHENIKCLFFHGVGGRGKYRGQLRTFHSNGYWGANMQTGVAANCDQYAVIDTDTFSRGWTNTDLIKDTCRAISHYQPYHASTIIFTHSMGGMYTRKAFSTDDCGWKGRYYQSQAPMNGSNAAKVPAKACLTLSVLVVGLMTAAGLTGGWVAILLGVVGGLIGGIVNTMKIVRPYCTMTLSGVGGKGYKSIHKTISYTVQAQTSSGQHKRADARLCGYSPKGYGVGASGALKKIQWAAGLSRKKWCKAWAITWWGHRWKNMIKAGNYKVNCPGGADPKNYPWNDGMVPVPSCNWWKGNKKIDITFMSVNHSDGTGREGTSTYYMKDINKWYTDRQV